jgi:glycosyltransferase involved in cell wall biosynthesis
MSEGTPLLVSCLCVTEGQPAFMPWLLWCFDHQRWSPSELVIVDSSPEPLQIAARDDIRLVTASPGTGVARKRNLALQEARGDVITWFDDDDWQHPHKLEWLVEALRDGAPYAGSTQGWFVELTTLCCTPYRGSRRGSARRLRPLPSRASRSNARRRGGRPYRWPNSVIGRAGARSSQPRCRSCRHWIGRTFLSDQSWSFSGLIPRPHYCGATRDCPSPMGFYCVATPATGGREVAT